MQQENDYVDHQSVFKNNWQRNKIQVAQAHQAIAFDAVNELVIKKRVSKTITLQDNTELTEFITCSYLGLDLYPSVIKAASERLEDFGVTFPCARTRAVVESFVELEGLLSQIFSYQHAVVFQSLHLVHLGLLPLVGSGEMPSYPIKDNGCFFILDKTVHASIQINRALLNQFGEVVMVDFQDMDSLENQFKLAHERKGMTPIAISDGIGSMGGAAPVRFLSELSELYDGYFYLDDAHGTSIHGQNGQGYVLKCLDEEMHPRLILTTSLAKAFGAVGGVVVLPTANDANMVKRFASTYIFGGPPPLSIINSAIAAARIHLSEEIIHLQNKLWDNVKLFDNLLADKIVNRNLISPIRGILIGDEMKTIEYAKSLRACHLAVTTALYPTVAKGRGMLRVAISAQHTQEEIEYLCNSVKALSEKEAMQTACLKRMHPTIAM